MRATIATYLSHVMRIGSFIKELRVAVPVEKFELSALYHLGSEVLVVLSKHDF